MNAATQFDTTQLNDGEIYAGAMQARPVRPASA